MVWVLWETNLILYTPTLEGAPDKRVSGQGVPCVILMSLLATGVQITPATQRREGEGNHPHCGGGCPL